MTTPGGLTGAPRRLLTLASVLKREGIGVCIASQSGSELLEAADAEGHETAAVDAVGVLALRQGALFGGGVAFRLRVLFDLLRQNWRLFRCIRSRQGDVVWIRGSKGIAFGAMGALLSRRPLIWDVGYELPSKGMVRWLHRLGLWISEAVVFQYSKAPEAIFGQRLAARYSHKIRTIIPGINLESLESFRLVSDQKRKPQEQPFAVLQVGTICDRKNQNLIVDAVTKINDKEADQSVEIWFAGSLYDEAYVEKLRKEIFSRKLDDVVRFLGWRSDVHRLMADADLLVVPSKDEGVPNAVQEAMVIGLPVVVSHTGGMPEVVTHGETGWVEPLDDANAWAERIRRSMQHPEDVTAVARHASAYAKRSFSVEAWGLQYARVLESVVPAARGV